MGRFIVRMERDGVERFLEWSTVVDAPVTYGLSEDDLRQHVLRRYGEESLEALPARLERARRNGTSALDGLSLAELFEGNRAGEGETCLTADEIWNRYCARRDTEGTPG